MRLFIPIELQGKEVMIGVLFFGLFMTIFSSSSIAAPQWDSNHNGYVVDVSVHANKEAAAVGNCYKVCYGGVGLGGPYAPYYTAGGGGLGLGSDSPYYTPAGYYTPVGK